MEMKVIAIGAEATIYLYHHPALDKDVIKKVRHPKSYRDPRLDAKIRTRRTRNEVRLLHQAKLAGVRVPYIYDIDVEESSITMEYIQGERLRDIMNPDLAKKTGNFIGKLHKANIIHGDLTTSNMLFSEELAFIDLSLGEISEDLESMGVDLNVLAENFKAIHTNVDFKYVLQGYKEILDIPIAEKMAQIQSRGRYLKRVE